MGLFSNKAPTAKFKRLGDEVEGEIVAFDQQQRTEFIRGGGVGDPMFWFKGKPTAGVAVDPATGEANRPVMDDVIVLDTGVADEYGETERRLFVKGKQQLEAIKAACRAAGVRDLDIGGRLACKWSDGEGGTGDPRQYTYRYAPPGQALAGAPVGAEAVRTGDGLQDVMARKTASATAAAERLTAKKTPAEKAKATTKAALGIPEDDQPPF